MLNTNSSIFNTSTGVLCLSSKFNVIKINITLRLMHILRGFSMLTPIRERETDKKRN